MIDTELPTAPSAGPLARGFAACLASVTEVPVSELPLPAGDLHQALGARRTRLAERGSGLVPIADATRFQWAADGSPSPRCASKPAATPTTGD